MEVVMSHFPENPFVLFIYWLLNTPGVGAVFVALLGGALVLTFALVLRWIIDGGKASENAVYVYPTEALHHHKE
jgi:hypothetical protein